MIKKFLELLSIRKEKKKEVEKSKKRKILEKKVEQGTDFVIHEYGDALRKLGAYDRK